VRLCVLTSCLAIAAAVGLPVAHPCADTDNESQSRLEIIRAATARIAFCEGRHVALFTGAELSYGELTLVADSIEHNSAERTVALSGAVCLRTPDYSLNTEECFVDLSTGRVTADRGLELANVTKGVTLKADRGGFWAEPKGNRVLRAELSGGVTARWDGGVTLQGGLLEADFEEQVHILTGDFTATVGVSLLPPPINELAGSELSLTGRDLTVRLEEGMPQVFHLAASAVRIGGEGLGLSGPDLIARLALSDGDEPLAESGMLHLSGSSSEPVSGWLVDKQGERLSFSAQSVEKAAGTGELILKNDVRVAGPDFSLHAQAVSVIQEEQEFRVTIPQRFRVVISPDVFQGGNSLNEHIEDA